MILLSKSSNVERSDTSSVQRVVTQFRIASAIILLLGFAGTLVTPWGINLLFGAEFAPAILPAMILSVATSVANIKLLLLETSRGLGEPAIGIGAESLGLLVTVVLLALLLPTWGAAGAAVTSLVSYCTSTVALAVLTSRRTKLPIRSFLVMDRADLLEVSAMVERMKSRTT
jgi:O-antigen/teichoic acid export membrane protein